MKKLFLYVLVGWFLIYGIWFSLPFFWNILYDSETLDILSWGGYGGFIDVSGPISYVFGFLYAVVLIGLSMFRKWARFLFFVLTFFTFISSPLWGMSIETGYESTLSYLLTLGDGVILTMAYLTNLSNEFK